MKTEKTRFAGNREVINMSAGEASVLLKTLRDVFDMVIIVDPEDQQIWDIDTDGVFKPVIPCYKIWGRSGPCMNCIPLKSCHELVTVDKYDAVGNDVYHITTKPIRIDGRLFAFEINTKLDDSEDINRRSVLLQEQERDLEVIKILASEYSSVYYIDLTTDELKPYAMNEETESEFGQIFNSGITYSEAFRMYVDRLIDPEDKERMLRNGSVNNICRQLKSQKAFTTQYLSSDGKYSEMKFVKVNAENEKPTAVALGFSDKNEQIRTEMEKRRYSSIANALSGTYDRVYYVNVKNNHYIQYNTCGESRQLGLNDYGENFFEASAKKLKESVSPEDYPIVSGFVDKSALLRELEEGNGDVSSKEYRVEADGKEVYYQLRALVSDEDRNHIIVGVSNVDALVRDRIEKQQEMQRNLEIIEILASEYSSVYYIDLESDALTPYSMNSETESEFGQIFNSGITYTEAFRMYVNRLIYPKDREMMLRNGSGENIWYSLRNQKSFVTQYRSMDGRYNEMKFVKFGGEKDEPVSVALGFADRDDKIRQEKTNERNREIIEILASEYSSVYFIDLLTDELNMYTANEETETTFGSVFRSGITYSEAFKLYVEKLVLREDKAMMLNSGSRENIVSELRNRKTFITRFRSADNKYSEMKFVKVGGEEDEPEAVALGFAEKDEEIRREQAIEAERKRNFDIIEILASEYSSVYYIDLEKDELDPYTMNDETESEFGRIFRSGIRYSEAFRMYVNAYIHPEDKTMMLKAGSIGNIMTELKNKKTFVTTYRSAEGHYSEMKFVKVGNEEGIPKAVALGFADKDEELRAKEEEAKILERNIDIIEILASEYSSVYYIDLETEELDPYTMNEETESEFGSIFRSGIKYSEAFRMYVDTLVYQEDRTRMLKAGSVYNIVRELETKKTFVTTYRSDNKGDPHYCEMKFVKVGDEDTPQAVALGFADKNDEIRTEIERKETLDRYTAVISGLTDDFSCIVYVNVDSAEEIHYRFDKTFESLIRDWKDIKDFKSRLSTLAGTIMHPDDRKAFLNATEEKVVMKKIRNGEPYFVNFRTLVDEKITYYQAKFAKDENTDNHIIVGFHNVDAETRREMDALEKAEAANKAKTTFLNSMSHDIRTPMNAIIGFTNMAEKHLDDREKVKDCLDKVKSSGEHLLKLINDVLDMARVESGRTVFDVEPTDILKTADELVAMLRQDAEAKGLEFRFNAAGVRNRYIYADKLHVNQVILNVLSNAIKYTKTGWVSYSIVETKSSGNGFGSYDFIVEDTGIGMSPELVETVFDSFVRAETATKSGIQGTGLGMSITKTLTDAMNGTIRIESTPEVGTKVVIHFDFRLFSGNLDDEGIAEHEFDDAVFKGKRVLLVEDNEMNREIAAEVLEESGLLVDTAADGTVAVEKLQESGDGAYDFVLMDIQMPVMDGYEATRKIRRMESAYCRTVPIIAMTANAFEDDRRLSLASGMNEHIAKPIDVNKMKETIARFL